MKKILFLLLLSVYSFAQTGKPQAIDNMATPTFKGVNIRKQTTIGTPTLGITIGNVGGRIVSKDSLGVLKQYLINTDVSGAYAPINNPTFTGNVWLPYSVRVGGTSSTQNNTFLGKNALPVSNIFGVSNTAIGTDALSLNTSGNWNSGVGCLALTKNTIGTLNTTVGANSLSENTIGSNNTAIGYGAGRWNTTGEGNTYIGYETGNGVATGYNNTIIGANLTGFSDMTDYTLIGSNGKTRIAIDNTGKMSLSGYYRNSTALLALNTSGEVVKDSTTYLKTETAVTTYATIESPIVNTSIGIKNLNAINGNFTNYTLSNTDFEYPNGALLFNRSYSTGGAVTSTGGAVTSESVMKLQNNKLKIGNGNDPQEILDVEGNILASGTIRATTSVVSPILYGGTGTTSSITYKPSTVTGATGADHDFQVGAGTTAMKILNSGNVGIGTTSPNYKLQVNSVSTGNVGINSNGGIFVNYQSETVPRIFIDRDAIGGGNAGIIFKTGGSGTQAANGSGIGSPASQKLALYTSNGTALTERMIIDGSGNVGVGVSSPQYKLHLKQNSAWGFLSQSSSNDAGVYIGNTGTESVISSSYESSAGYTPLKFQTSGIDRIHISNTGNVGIGITSPSEKLEVTGNAKFQHLIGNTSSPTIAAGTGAGTSPTVSITKGTDLSGVINVTTGTLPTLSATVVTVTFNVAFGSAPKVILKEANGNAAMLNGVNMVVVDDANTTTTTFQITAGTTALTAATSYKWYYTVSQ